MRLAFCNATRGWGGVKTWTLEFAVAMQQRGHAISVFGRAGDFIDRALTMGLDAHPINFGPDYNPIAITKFFSFFKQNNIDAALVNVGRDLRTAGIAARLAGIPLVQRIGLPGDQKNVWKVRALHHVVRPHYLYPCAFNRDGMRKEHPYIPLRDTTVIHSAKSPATEIPPNHTPRQLITTSQLKKDKGHEQVLIALAALKQEGHSFHWHIAGKGSQEHLLKQQAQQLGLTKEITWHGWTHDVPSLLSQADIFVLPSLSEGLPNTLLEAMSTGLAPLSRNVGGVHEVWPSALQEFLLPYEANSAEIATGLRILLTAPATKLEHWKNIALQQCRDHFSLQIQAQKLEHFFQTIIQEHTR